MLIDWFTVAAQALNFLILVWLMKRYLYKPILHAIDEREKRVAKELADADKKQAEARHERDTFQQKIESFDQQRAELMRKADEEAKAERQHLIEPEPPRLQADAPNQQRETQAVPDPEIF